MKTEYTNNRQREMGGLDSGFPRRSRLDLNTPAELSIFNAMQEVEKAGCDVRLTDAINLLSKAKDLVANYVDGIEPTPSPSTVDFEREADELYPDFIVVNKNGTEENLSIPERKAYINGRQTTSQEGLRELVEWVKGEAADLNDSDNLTDKAAAMYLRVCVITKANEILNKP